MASRPGAGRSSRLSASTGSTSPTAAGANRLEREIALLREYRTRLTADVVTGKLDVRAAAANLTAETAEPEPTEDAAEDVEIDTDLDDEGAPAVAD